MKHWPALDIRSAEPSDRLLAWLDDFGPSAVEERDRTLRAFFPTLAARDAAATALGGRFEVSSVDVPDEDWARRSQESLAPVIVGRVTVTPPWVASAEPSTSNPPNDPKHDNDTPLVVTIQPSMGFGTGHHPTTRLCLAALQAIDLADRFVLDVGTGSGVLAITAVRLGAARALGIDSDADAILSATENLALNKDDGRVVFEIGDLTTMALPQADVVAANLTGALLVRAASVLETAVSPGGTLVVSGLLGGEREAVCRAFAGLEVVSASEESGWLCLLMKKPVNLSHRFQV